MIRELYEETGLLRSSDNFRILGTFYVVSPDVSFLYALYRCDISLDSPVTINSVEHAEYQWVYPVDALRLELVPDLDDCLRVVLPELQPEQAQYDLFTELPSFTADNYEALEAAVPVAVRRGEFLAKQSSKRYWASFGPPGAGKTTALRAMQKLNPMLTLVQDQSILNRRSGNLRSYLKKAWEDNLRAYFFHFQMEVLPFRFWYTCDAPNNALVDETIYSTLAYSRTLHALRWISDSEYQTFYANYLTYLRLLPKPQGLLYFHCEPATLVSRIDKRGRMLEAHYPPQYVETLAAMFEELATELGERVEVVRIDTGKRAAADLARQYVPRN